MVFAGYVWALGTLVRGLLCCCCLVMIRSFKGVLALACAGLMLTIECVLQRYKITAFGVQIALAAWLAIAVEAAEVARVVKAAAVARVAAVVEVAVVAAVVEATAVAAVVDAVVVGTVGTDRVTGAARFIKAATT